MTTLRPIYTKPRRDNQEDHARSLAFLEVVLEVSNELLGLALSPLGRGEFDAIVVE